jgi:translocation and assembly module TamB
LRVSYDGAPVLAIAEAARRRGCRQRALHVEQLRLDSDRGRIRLHGDYQPAHDYRTELKGSWQVPARDGRPAARVGFGARGSLAAMQVEVRGIAPGPLSASLALHGRTRPQWRLRGQLDGFDPALFTGAPTAPAW